MFSSIKIKNSYIITIILYSSFFNDISNHIMINNDDKVGKWYS